MLNDREFLEKRLELFTMEAWKTLYLRRGQVDMLNMIINLEETTKLALDQLEE